MSMLLGDCGPCSCVEVRTCGRKCWVVTHAPGFRRSQIGDLTYRLRFFFFRLSLRSFWRLDLYLGLVDLG